MDIFNASNGTHQSSVTLEPTPSPISATELPESFALQGNHPNPFHPQTTITFDLPAPASVQVVLYNLLGEKVKTVGPVSMAPASNRTITLTTTTLPAGVYLYKLRAEMAGQTVARTGKMTVVN